MDEILKQTLLYDFYGELLTEHQKEIYEQVVLEDYSLSEIAKEAGISRQLFLYSEAARRGYACGKQKYAWQQGDFLGEGGRMHEKTD